MNFDVGDVPAWVALIVSVVSVLVAVRATRHARDSAGAARRSADAAERQAAAAEAAVPPPPPAVDWRIVHQQKSRYVLRNVGVETATGVQIQDHDAILWAVDEVPTEVPPNAGVPFLIAATMGNPAPDELWVTWDGRSIPVAVPIP
ncbi:hypothetical protein O7626_08345 [Micromonospora sp. WMMD1102]|uniref:hypothetical protein n=1 Tax=Micromonospora sp. WMMD1102 TaxID=3016105 RepID=UPI00241594A1|nr:hypothetical protein [Micromonospora sp. WMMD1102]MDG4785935.1 hypothetical protein [Micromonospora sp. WMMD1102]